MKIETLTSRIENAKARIEKKQSTVSKKTEWIAKKKAKLPTLSAREREWAEWDINDYTDDIARLNKEIQEIQKSLESYEQQLSGEIEKESILLKDIPESMKRMQDELVEKWDEWDKRRRDNLKKEYNRLGWAEFFKRRTGSEYRFKDKTDEQIHNSNLQDAKALIIDLYYRVKNITGEITDWSDIRAEQGACGITVLNGYVVGKSGRCFVESIYAGGYNVQRLHIRVLVKECQ